jgi:hypothetical protein
MSDPVSIKINFKKKLALLVAFAFAATGFMALNFLEKKGSASGMPTTDTVPQGRSSDGLTDSSLQLHQPQGHSILYDPRVAVRLQLSTLMTDASRGNSYAACVLARSLDLCGRYKQDLPIHEYSDEYLLSLDREELDAFSKALELREDRLSVTCIDISADDVRDSSQVLFRSALMGNHRSMEMFALLPQLPQDYESLAIKELQVPHRLYAEKMLNRAAEAGSLNAISSVADAYGSGYIISAFDNIPVKQDDAKTIAAMRALIAIGGHALRKKMTPDDIASTQEWIQFAMSGMSQAELRRTADLESAYVRAYHASGAENSLTHDLLDDFPEESCAEHKTAIPGYPVLAKTGQRRGYPSERAGESKDRSKDRDTHNFPGRSFHESPAARWGARPQPPEAERAGHP